MLCQKCGTELPIHANYCPNCGTKINQQETQTAEPKPPENYLLDPEAFISRLSNNEVRSLIQFVLKDLEGWPSNYSDGKDIALDYKYIQENLRTGDMSLYMRRQLAMFLKSGVLAFYFETKTWQRKNRYVVR